MIRYRYMMQEALQRKRMLQFLYLLFSYSFAKLSLYSDLTYFLFQLVNLALIRFMFSPSRKEWERTMIISFIRLLLCCCKCKYLYTALSVCYEDLVVFNSYEVCRLAVISLTVANLLTCCLVENYKTV